MDVYGVSFRLVPLRLDQSDLWVLLVGRFVAASGLLTSRCFFIFVQGIVCNLFVSKFVATRRFPSLKTWFASLGSNSHCAACAEGWADARFAAVSFEVFCDWVVSVCNSLSSCSVCYWCGVKAADDGWWWWWSRSWWWWWWWWCWWWWWQWRWRWRWRW